MKGPRLLLILNDDLQALVRKGELVPRYYNPANLFGRITILGMQNREWPRDMESLAGDAEVDYRFVGKPSVVRSLGYLRLGPWLREAERIAAGAEADVIRVYSPGVNAELALQLRRSLNVPVLSSTHGEQQLVRRLAIAGAQSAKEKARLVAHAAVIGRLERRVVPKIDAHIAVYESAAGYLRRLGARHVDVIYNSVSSAIEPKHDYKLAHRPLILNVGVQKLGVKHPLPIIQAMDSVKAILHVVGDGDAHQSLRRAAEALDDPTRVDIRGFVSNAAIAATLRDYDLYAFRTHAPEISKSVIEAMLAGLPILMNADAVQQVPELREADFVEAVEDSPAGWARAIRALLEDDARREAMGRRAREVALRHYAPERTEAAHADAYRRLIGRSR
jgi:glycosyltransferase involved in cell wall biosynthesis